MKNQRKRSLRRLTAKNFLSNISLDGTFADTNHLFHIWKHHKQKIDVDPKNAEGVGDEIAIPESTTKEIPVTIMTGSRIKRNSESDTVNIPPKSITGRNTANIVSQPERPDGSELSMDKDKVWTPSKRWRYSYHKLNQNQGVLTHRYVPESLWFKKIHVLIYVRIHLGTSKKNIINLLKSIIPDISRSTSTLIQQ